MALKGGFWSNNEDSLCVTDLLDYTPTVRSNDFWIRCAEK